MKKFWIELLSGKHPAVVAWTGGLIALFMIVPIFSEKFVEFVGQQDAKYKIDTARVGEVESLSSGE